MEQNDRPESSLQAASRNIRLAILSANKLRDILQMVLFIKCCACVKGCPAEAKYFDDAGYLYHKSELEEVYARPAANEVFL